MKHRTIRGKILYLDNETRETGREWFTITVQPDGRRTLRAQCEMDDRRLLRDVIYSVDADWYPLDCFVRLSIEERLTGTGWFRFTDRLAECETFTAAAGRLSQRRDLTERTPSFGAHPVVCDIWHLARFDRSKGERIQTSRNVLLSAREPDGGSGPMFSAMDLTIEYVGREEVTVPAGTFEADHFRFLLDNVGMEPEELWCVGEDFLPIKIAYPIFNATYELAELTQ